MKKSPLGITLLISLGLLFITSCSQKHVLLVNNLPSNTPKGSSVFVMGDFNNWNPADSAFMLEYDVISHSYSIELPSSIKKGNYTYTRGGTESIETDICGNNNTPRILVNEEITIDTIEGWLDIEHEKCEQLTFIIKSDEGIIAAGEEIYLATEQSKWQPTNPEFLFKYQPNGTYVLQNVFHKGPIAFNLFRDNQQQFEEAQIASQLSDTLMLVIANTVEETPEEPTQKHLQERNQQGKKNKQHPTEEPIKKTSEKPLPKITIEKVERPKPLTHVVTPIVAPPFATIPVSKELAKPKVVEEVKPTAPTKSAGVTTPAIVKAPEKIKKVMVIIDKQPSFAKDDDLYLSADFNNWDLADPNYLFRVLPNGKKYLMLRLSDIRQHTFKISRGDEGTDEANFKEEAVDLHVIKKGVEDDTLHIKIDSWMDTYPRKRLVFYLTDVPENTPEDDNIFLMGNFNNWQTDDTRYKFKNLGEDRYVLTIDDFSKRYTEYKISRGSMTNEAVAQNGRVPKGQPFDFIRRDTIKLRIDRWKDLR